MLRQIESQSKHHRVLVNGQEIFGGDVLLEALQQYNKARQKFNTSDVQFESACTYKGVNHNA